MKRSIIIILVVLSVSAPAALAEHKLKITDYDTTVSEARETRLYLSSMTMASYNLSATPTSNISLFDSWLQHDYFYDSYYNSWNYKLYLRYQAVSSSFFPGGMSNNMWNYEGDYNYNVYFMPEQNIFHGFGIAYSGENQDNGYTSVYQENYIDFIYNIGIGHIVNITPLAEAGVMEDRLMEEGLLKGNLSKSEMLKIAELNRKYDMNEYNYKNHDTAKGKYLEDVANVIEKSGQLTRPLGGLGYWRLNEFRTVNYIRQKGYNLTFMLVNDCFISQNHFTSPRDEDFNATQNCYGNLRYRVYYPIDWKTQVMFQIDTAVVLSANDDWKQNFHSIDLMYSYDLTNKLWLTAEFYIARNNYKDEDKSNDESSKGYSGGINYKIEDSWLSSLIYSVSYYDSGDQNETITAQQKINF